MYSFMSISAPLLLILTTVLIIVYDFLKYRITITPFTVLASPITVIISTINFFGVQFGFYQAQPEGVLFILLCLVCFRIGGGLLPDIKFNIKQYDEIEYRKIFYFILIISIIGMSFKLITSYMKFHSLADEAFISDYGSGIFGHLQLLGYIGFIYVFNDFMKKKSFGKLALIFSMFVLVAIEQTKYKLFLLLISAVIFYLIFNKISLKKILIYSFLFTVSAFLLFLGIYTITFLSLGNFQTYDLSNIYGFIVYHFFCYIFSSLIEFTTEFSKFNWLYYEENFTQLFSVPINIFKAMIGQKDYVEIISWNWISISPEFQGNAGSIFTPLYRGLTPVGVVIFFTILGQFAYQLFTNALACKSIITNMINAFFLAILALGFFCYYFNNLTIYEIPAYILFVPKFLKILVTKFKKIILNSGA